MMEEQSKSAIGEQHEAKLSATVATTTMPTTRR